VLPAVAPQLVAKRGSKRYRADLWFFAFDVPILAGLDVRPLPSQVR